MRQRELINKMHIDEMMEWLAYDTSCSEDFKKELEEERLDNLSPEEEAEEVFKLMGW